MLLKSCAKFETDLSSRTGFPGHLIKLKKAIVKSYFRLFINNYQTQF